MRAPDDLKPKSFSLNLTPLIDVVFLLIIFFIVSDSMIKQESSIKLDLPSASTGEKTKPKETGKIIINVVAKDILFFGDSPISLQDLSRRLREERMKTEIPLEVRIRTNRQVPYSVIEPVLVLCAQAGIGNVSFSVLEGSDP